MTAQLSRERLEALANLQSLECMALPASHAESAQMARMLLEGMDSEPVKRFNADQMHRICLEANRHLDKYGAMAREANKLLGRIPAPPAPVAVPDVGEFRIFTQAGGVKVAVKDGKTKNHLFGMGWNACRAAILNAGPVTGWIKCSERMPVDRDSVLLWDADLDDALSGHYSHDTGNFYQAGMVVDNEITHWMPLPAGPEQEV